MEFVNPVGMLQQVALSLDRPDGVLWKWTPNGDYTAKSVYDAQFLGLVERHFECFIWKPWAPQKRKIFTCLLIQQRLPTTDKLAMRYMPNDH